MSSPSSPSSDTPVRSFYGQYPRGLDKKGRAILPAQYREILGDEEVFITKGIDKCLLILPAEEYERRRKRMETLSQTSKHARLFRRRFFTQTFRARPDSIGRINIPTHLREYAGLKGDVVFAGMDTHIELWDAEAWKQHEAELDADELQEAWEELNI
jgi:MraZ protein